MKRKIIRIIILLLIVAGLVSLSGGFNSFRLRFKNSTARAVGDLEIDWGVPSGSPIFVINNLLPGDTEIRQVKITNNAAVLRPVSIRGVKTSETGNLSTVLDFFISENGTELYAKTLNQFITESAGINGIPLFTLNPGATKTINFKATFKESADNQFQNTSIVFDLIIGIAAEIPQECRSIQFIGQPIFGTSGNDNLKGTNGNDLIFGFEGNDKINGGNGDDCIVGGPGNDRLDGSNGNDVIFGNEGDDKINGGNGDDLIFAGPGNDVVDGSNGNDKIYSGEGDDNSDGGNGNDYIEGNEGNDTLRGRNGDDILLGGEGTDIARGDLGKDTCEAETKIKCEN